MKHNRTHTRTHNALARLPGILGLVAIFALLLPVPAAPATAEAAKADTTLRVVSYNIHAGRGMDGRIDLPRIAAVLRRLDAGVILLQEVDMGTKRSGGVLQAVELAKLLGMHFYFAKSMNYGGGEFGNAILSKHPLEHASTLPLAGGVEPRSAGFVEIVLPARQNRNDNNKIAARAKAGEGEGGLRVMLVGVHLDHRNKETHMEHVKKISNEVARLTAKRPCAAVIWGGDFNATEASPIWDVLTKEHGWLMPQKQGATKADRATIPSVKPAREIDWFIYRAAEKKNGAKTQTFTVLEHRVESEPMASDHCPVVFALGVYFNSQSK